MLLSEIPIAYELPVVIVVIVPEFVTVEPVLVTLSGPVQLPVLLEFAVHDCE